MEKTEKQEAALGLSARIVAAISAQEVRRAQRLFAASVVTGIASAFGAVMAFRYAAAEFANSGAGTYLSLLSSDFDVVAAHWKEFALSLGESLPVFAIILGCAAVAVFLGSVRVFVDTREANVGFSGSL